MGCWLCLGGLGLGWRGLGWLGPGWHGLGFALGWRGLGFALGWRGLGLALGWRGLRGLGWLGLGAICRRGIQLLDQLRGALAEELNLRNVNGYVDIWKPLRAFRRSGGAASLGLDLGKPLAALLVPLGRIALPVGPRVGLGSLRIVPLGRGEQLSHVGRHVPLTAERTGGAHVGLEIGAQIKRRGVALGGVLGQRHHDDIIELVRDPLGNLGRRQRVFVQDQPEHLDFVGPPERPPAGQQLVEDHPDGVDVTPTIHSARLARPEDLLRREVGELALDATRLGTVGAGSRRLGDPEVEHLGDAGEGDHDVLRRHVPVDDAERCARVVTLVVGVVECVACREGHTKHQPLRHPRLGLLVGALELPQRTAGDVLHRDEVGAAQPPQIEDLNDIGVVEPRGKQRLVDEHPDELRILRVVRQDRLDDDVLGKPLDACRPGKPHLGHAPGRQTASELVATESLAFRNRLAHRGQGSSRRDGL